MQESFFFFYDYGTTTVVLSELCIFACFHGYDYYWSRSTTSYYYTGPVS